MMYILFAGDMIVMAFMVIVVVWVSLFVSDAEISEIAKLPLVDDDRDG